MRLASYVPGELIPLPLSGSIPELPHVAKVENRTMPKISRNGFLHVSTAAGSLAPMRRSVVSFVRNNEVPHIATYKTHQRSQKFSFVTQKRLLQQYPPGADIVTAGRHV